MVKILVDDRERELTEFLDSFEIEHDFKRLEVGDVIINNEIIIERKTSEDFLTSMLDGRLFSQIKGMNENFEKPLIIIDKKTIYSKNRTYFLLMGRICILLIVGFFFARWRWTIRELRALTFFVICPCFWHYKIKH